MSDARDPSRIERGCSLRPSRAARIGSGHPKRVGHGAFLVALVVILLLVVSGAQAFYEPDGFRGVTWGMSLEDAERALTGLHAKRLLAGQEPLCQRERRNGALTESAVCVAAMDMDSVRLGLYFEFHQERFVAVTAVSAPASYADLKRALIARYGAPTRAETKTKAGPFSEYASEEVLWEGPTVRIKLSQYVGDRTFTVAVIALRSELDRQAAEREKSPDAPPPR